MRLETPRLTLVAATVEHARAELAGLGRDWGEFARLLGAAVPENWPPESARDALPLFLEWLEAAPHLVGWYGWYALLRDDDSGGLPTLVGGGGFLGAPKAGVATAGYSVLPQFQGRGYATELVGALINWALGQSGVTAIAAQTEGPNPASERVLAKLGFHAAGPAGGGGARFEFRPALT